MKRSILNQSGFSMVQAMLLTGMVSVMAVIGTQLTTNAKKTEKGATARDNTEQFHNILSEAFANRDRCTRTMIQNAKQVDIIGTGSFSLSSIYSEDDLIASVGGVYMNNSVSLESINVLPPNTTLTGTRDIEISYGRLMDQNMAKRTGSGFGGKNLKKTLTIRVVTDTTGAFSSCYSIVTAKTDMNSTASTEFGDDVAKQLCLEMSTGSGATKPVMVWDEAKSRCVLGGQCQPGEIYYGIDSSGNYLCRVAKDTIDLTSSIDPFVPSCSTGNTVKLEVVSGKIKLVCETSGGIPTTGGTSGGTTTGTTTGGETPPASEAPTLSYEGATGTIGTIGTFMEVSPTTLLDNGAPILSCAISPGLPSGVTINSSTCVISGTPIAVSPLQLYTVTVNNTVGSSSAYVSLDVNPLPPTISFAGATGTTGNIGMPMTISPTTLDNGGENVTCSVSPTLPASLALNTSTCVISGTPSVSINSSFTVTATNTAGSSNASVTITATAVIIKPTLSFSGVTGNNGTFGTAMTVAPTSFSDNGSPTTCSISPAPSAGLLFNTSTCTISGTPNNSLASTTYTITATNSAGPTTATVTVSVAAIVPDILYNGATGTTVALGATMTVTPTTLNANGAPITGCSITPPLKASLSINSTTCVISGTADTTDNTGSYSITATNSAGNSKIANVILTVTGQVPTISYSGSSGTTGSVGSAMSVTPTTLNGNGYPISNCTITPTLPAGLSINTTTCVISGTPTATKALTTYTVRAYNSLGNKATTVGLTVNAAVPTISYSGATGTTVTLGSSMSVTPTTLTGTPLTNCTISPSLPCGLSISTSTCVISGTPSSTLSTNTYSVIATNSTGSSTPATVSLAVNGMTTGIPEITYGYIYRKALVDHETTITPKLIINAASLSNCTVSPALPAGLNIDASSCIIYGIPTAVSANKTYTVTASNIYGNKTTTVNIEALNKTCPTGYIPVPANSSVGANSNFCVARYEMKNVSSSPVSSPNGNPWVSININDAATKCKSIGPKYDLISNQEWMAIARNIEVQGDNLSNMYSTFTGGGYYSRGWSAGNASWAVDCFGNTSYAPQTDQNCVYNVASNTCGKHGDWTFNRVHLLNNGYEIWDLAGNVSEWVDWDKNSSGVQAATGTCSNTPGAHIELVNVSCSFGTTNYAPFMTLNSTHNVGKFINHASKFYVQRSSGWYHSPIAGIYHFRRDSSDTDAPNTTGFRCVFRP